MSDHRSSSPLPATPGLRFPASQRPLLVVVIDCEEDFDWDHPVHGTEYAVESTSRLGPIQAVFADAGVVPTYVVGYPIVDHATAWIPLARLMDSGACLIGAHLHPWATPPHLEDATLRNSFPGNLPADLELAKLGTLTDRITERFGSRPTIYKAGRYGFGPGTLDALRALGFRLDLSFMPHWDYQEQNGPSFLGSESAPFWLDDAQDVLEIPATSGFTGLARAMGPSLYGYVNSRRLRPLRLPGLLSRSGVLNRVRLTPEGVGLDEARQLTRALLADGQRVFQLAFHSTSLVPGSAPYVRNEADLQALIGWMRDYFTFFCNELGGQPVSHNEALIRARQLSSRIVEPLAMT